MFTAALHLDNAPNILTLVKPQLFELRSEEKGLSVFADTVTPRATLQAMIDFRRECLTQGDMTAQEWLIKNPDVETLVQKSGWGVLKIPVSEFLERGFALSEVEENGHLNILGSAEQFTNSRFDFVELVAIGVIMFLSEDECLA